MVWGAFSCVVYWKYVFKKQNQSFPSAFVNRNMIEEKIAEEKFIQTATTKSQEVEIIWVIDNSGSMENNQTKLAESFDSFIDTFLVNGKSDFPFKMGVTTTEAYRNDKDKWEDYDLTSYAAESDLTLFKENFKKAVKVGDGGSGDERCLESAFTMVENDPNWFGGDETLSVYILVSDEPEQSFKDTNNNDITIAQWAQKFQNLKLSYGFVLFCL